MYIKSTVGKLHYIYSKRYRYYTAGYNYYHEQAEKRRSDNS